MNNSKQILPSSEDMEAATSKGIVKAMAVKVFTADMVASNPQPQALQLCKLLQEPQALLEPEAQRHQISVHNMLNIMAAKIHMLRTVGIKTTLLVISITSNKPRSSKRLQALLHRDLRAKSRHHLLHQVDLLPPPMVATTL